MTVSVAEPAVSISVWNSLSSRPDALAKLAMHDTSVAAPSLPAGFAGVALSESSASASPCSSGRRSSTCGSGGDDERDDVPMSAQMGSRRKRGTSSPVLASECADELP